MQLALIREWIATSRDKYDKYPTHRGAPFCHTDVSGRDFFSCIFYSGLVPSVSAFRPLSFCVLVLDGVIKTAETSA